MGDSRTLDLKEYFKETSDLIFIKGLTGGLSTEQCTKLVYRKMTLISTLRDARCNASEIN